MPSLHGDSARALNAPLLAHLERGGTVLTSGRREARHLRQQFDAAQLGAGREVWPAADVLPLAAWMADRWAELAAHDAALPVLLDDAQSDWRWRVRVEASAGGSLLASHDLAAAARQAWISLRRHAGTLDLLDAQATTRDQRLFQGWARQVEQDLTSHGWLDPGLLEVALAASAAQLDGGRDLMLAGFHHRPPAVRALLEALSQTGHLVTVAPLARSGAAVRGYAASDPQDELQALASWLRARLLEDPAASLAAVVPDLPARRDALERTFESVLQPQLELPGALERERVFDLAGGAPLAALAVADAALACLDACGATVDAPLLGRLLLNRHLGAGDDEVSRTQLELRLRRTGVTRWNVAALASLARDATCPGFARALQAAADCRGSSPRRGADRWAQMFGEVLAAWRWPGDEPLATDEYQAAQALRDRLARFAALARTAPPLSFEEARAEFGRLVQGPHQPERGEPSVLVFDRLEPTGIAFDGLWVAGLGAPSWPRAASPDPFIPVWVQQELGMPGATAADCLAEAIATTDSWRGAARQVVFSWPVQQDDSRVEDSRVLPASLAVLDPAARLPGRARSLFDAGGPEPMQDTAPPPLDPQEARGGARIFELQSQCPFRAFAELRLAARPLEQPGAGIDARQRGSILHRALELLWGTLGGREALDQDEAHLRERVDACVERALSERLPAALGRQLWDLEREWQCAAVTRELELERERGGFRVIAREAPVRRQLAGLPLWVVPDRADRLPDGSTVLIDYKTGDPSLSHWRGRRPEQPQLPLYAVLLGEEVGGIAFAAVTARSARFLGVGRSAELLPGLRAAEDFQVGDDPQDGYDWEQIRASWTDTLTELAAAHLRGDARVSPRSPAACRACHLQTLCRVSGAVAEAGAGDDE